MSIAYDNRVAVARFGSSVQSTAFSLTLSRGMIRALAYIRNYEMRLVDAGACTSGLSRREMIRWDAGINLGALNGLGNRGLIWQDTVGDWHLSEAGVLTHRLLGVAGMLNPETDVW